MKSIFVITLIIILSMSGTDGRSLPYKVLSKDALNRIEEEKRSEVDTFYIIDYNGVFVTIFTDGTAILLPPVLGGEEGLLFSD